MTAYAEPALARLSAKQPQKRRIPGPISIRDSQPRQEFPMFVPMPEGVRLSAELPDWVKLSIADAIVTFGRIEQEMIEISWILNDADLKQKLKLAKIRATENFVAVLESVGRAEAGLKLDALKERFKTLATERNLIVHGAWTMTDEKPWVVWHKFLEDDDSIIGEHFEKWRFDRFVLNAGHILNILRLFHDQLEQKTGVRTSAVPRS
jgi:hypothetical protein